MAVRWRASQYWWSQRRSSFEEHRTYGPQDVTAFLGLTGDTNFLHTDAGAARQEGVLAEQPLLPALLPQLGVPVGQRSAVRLLPDTASVAHVLQSTGVCRKAAH